MKLLRIILFLRSPHFIIGIMVALILSIAGGSFLPPEQGEKFVYQAWWFQGLLVLFGLSMILSAVRKNLFKFNRLGFILTHLSIILTALGIILYSVNGFSVFCTMATGDSLETVEIDGRYIPLGFKFQLVDFNIPRDAQGQPQQFESLAQIYNGNRLVLTKKITVNNPLYYEDWRFYQADYNHNNERETVLQIKKAPGVYLIYAGFLVMAIGLSWLTLKPG